MKNGEFELQEKLELMRRYLEGLPKINRDGISLYFYNLHNPLTKFSAYCGHLLGCDGFAQVVSDREFQKIGSRIWYRGYGDREHMANALVDFNYHPGVGLGSGGIYLTTSYKIASSYAGHNEARVLTCKIDGETKLIDEMSINLRFDKGIIDGQKCDPITDQIRAFLETLPEFECEKFIKYLQLNMGIYAMLLGFDGIRVNDNCVTILNRAKIVVSASEFKRATDGTEFYDGGKINFDAKYKNPSAGFPEK